MCDILYIRSLQLGGACNKRLYKLQSKSNFLFCDIEFEELDTGLTRLNKNRRDTMDSIEMSSSQSAEDISQHLPADSALDLSRSSSSTVSSLMELGWTEEEHFTVERIQRLRRQLEDEIEVSESGERGGETSMYR